MSQPTDPLLKALLFAHIAAASEGHSVMPIPKGYVAGGPCPQCGNLVSPNPQGYTFVAEGAKAGPDSPRLGLVVCSRCATPLLFEKPGHYQKIPRKALRQLPRVTQKFIKREQECVAILKRHIN